eukprot:TRINITY_DN3876_c0_g1_i7.p1 TRINITY_DN3876_c0_g1~~TRINITY_DN3876_c0_g1_i7.p1  ORF type:complete len:150 (+),score=34.49 TRINITY_DN3876_c0_g1_i7:151-600(+)
MCIRDRHNPAWSEHPAGDGTVYYYNSETSESVWEKPVDFNPSMGKAAIPGMIGPQTKGPPGANLFLVRKLRRGEYDSFSDKDLHEAFSKYGRVLRCEMTTDPATGWSKGFGFLSFDTVDAADQAMASMNGSWLAGKQMKLEKTKEDQGH